MRYGTRKRGRTDAIVRVQMKNTCGTHNALVRVQHPPAAPRANRRQAVTHAETGFVRHGGRRRTGAEHRLRRKLVESEAALPTEHDNRARY